MYLSVRVYSADGARCEWQKIQAHWDGYAHHTFDHNFNF